MANCCICDFVVKKDVNIYHHSTGKPPILISDLINDCIQGTKYKLKSDGICKKCLNTINRYHRAKQIVSQVRNEVLELFLHTSQIIEDSCYHQTDDGSIFLDYKPQIQNEISNIEPDGPIINNSQECNENIEGYDTLEEFIEEDIEEAEQETYEEIGSGYENITEEATESIGVEIEECYIDNSSIESETIDIQDLSNDDISQYDDDIIYIGKKEPASADEKVKSAGRKKTYCTKCNEVFNDSKDYRIHYKKFHFAGYICDECGKTLYSYSGFLNHKQGHNPVKKFECPDCGERYHLKIQLKYHMAWHSGEKPFQCEICSKQFVHRVALYKHKKLHESNERRYGCYVCGSKFRTSAHLRRHSMTHTGAKPHSCPICGKCFAQAYNMRVHLREHNKPGSSRSKRHRHQCEKCSATFTSKKNFTEHLIRCNENITLFVTNLRGITS